MKTRASANPTPKSSGPASTPSARRSTQRLTAGDVRLTMGGEPTFVSIDDMEGAEWTIAAVGPNKQRLADELIRRLSDRFATGALLHFGQGKWYPGESLPRWAYACLWRKDGEPIWNNPALLADVSKSLGVAAPQAEEFVTSFAKRLGVASQWIQPAYEDLWHLLGQEQKLPIDVDPWQIDADDSEERRRLARALKRGLQTPVGYVLPLTRAWWQANARWSSGPWPVRTEHLFLIPGDSAIGLRLPLESLPIEGYTGNVTVYNPDPFDRRDRLPAYVELRRVAQDRRLETESRVQITEQKKESEVRSQGSVGTGRTVGEARCGRLATPRWTSRRRSRRGSCARPCASSRGSDGCTSSCRRWGHWRTISNSSPASKTPRKNCNCRWSLKATRPRRIRGSTSSRSPLIPA